MVKTKKSHKTWWHPAIFQQAAEQKELFFLKKTKTFKIIERNYLNAHLCLLFSSTCLFISTPCIILHLLLFLYLYICYCIYDGFQKKIQSKFIIHKYYFSISFSFFLLMSATNPAFLHYSSSAHGGSICLYCGTRRSKCVRWIDYFIRFS